MSTFRQPFQDDWPITQKYGEKITSSFHTGIDYGCPAGTRILSSADGVVVFAGEDKTGYGKCVIIRHSSYKSTLYAHLSMILVYSSEIVSQGECIGLSGNTGNSTGPHLHFEARTQWNQPSTHFDPMELPLMSVDDSINSPSKSDENKLIDASELKKGKVEIVCPAGAFGHSPDFANKWAFPFGETFEFTGETETRKGLTFCKCCNYVWIAANDKDTQILKNVPKG